MLHPNYSKIIKYLDKTEQLENDGIQDHLEEIVLNDFVYTILENHPTLDKDQIVDTVYDGIRKILDHFTYFNNCSISDGYSMALYDVKHENEEVYNSLVLQINKEAETNPDEDSYADLS